MPSARYIEECAHKRTPQCILWIQTRKRQHNTQRQTYQYTHLRRGLSCWEREREKVFYTQCTIRIHPDKAIHAHMADKIYMPLDTNCVDTTNHSAKGTKRIERTEEPYERITQNTNTLTLCCIKSACTHTIFEPEINIKHTTKTAFYMVLLLNMKLLASILHWKWWKPNET